MFFESHVTKALLAAFKIRVIHNLEHHQVTLVMALFIMLQATNVSRDMCLA